MIQSRFNRDWLVRFMQAKADETLRTCSRTGSKELKDSEAKVTEIGMQPRDLFRKWTVHSNLNIMLSMCTFLFENRTNPSVPL